MTGHEALTKLFADPKKFLKQHRLKVTAHFTATVGDAAWLYNDSVSYGGRASFEINNGPKPVNGDPVSLGVFGVRVYSYGQIDRTALHQIDGGRHIRRGGEKHNRQFNIAGGEFAGQCITPGKWQIYSFGKNGRGGFHFYRTC